MTLLIKADNPYLITTLIKTPNLFEWCIYMCVWFGFTNGYQEDTFIKEE